MFSLITSYYKTNNSERQNEINECLLHNCKNKYIKHIYLLNAEMYNLEFLGKTFINKITQIVVNEVNKERLYYYYAIIFINEHLSNEKCILSNSDIYFDDTLQKIEDYNFDKTLMALSRYDNGELYDRSDSQDSWIFVSPLNVNIYACNFKFGQPGCDNLFASIIKNAGYEVLNPSKTIHTHHLHDSSVRTYTMDERAYGNYYYVIPTKLV